MAIHCPECGFVNAEGANYCQKCGAYLSRPEGSDEPTTMTYKVDETGEYTPVDIDEEVGKAGAALVIRSGGGRAGESFTLDDERGGDQTTITYKVDETGELKAVDLDRVVEAEGAALVIRSGGGRAGESFAVEGERMAIGRSPDANVFLDDVTVSRNHALLVKRRDGLYVDDLGSLNGTYVNRRRIESHKLQSGDELQVGKYKLTYLER